jgi:hypothetical protein
MIGDVHFFLPWKQMESLECVPIRLNLYHLTKRWGCTSRLLTRTRTRIHLWTRSMRVRRSGYLSNYEVHFISRFEQNFLIFNTGSQKCLARGRLACSSEKKRIRMNKTRTLSVEVSSREEDSFCQQ